MRKEEECVRERETERAYELENVRVEERTKKSNTLRPSISNVRQM